MDTIRPYAPKRRRRNQTRLITSINQARRAKLIAFLSQALFAVIA
jgi:hypothetical protein